MYEIILKITAPSQDHLQCAIAAGLITETFLNAANGENYTTEWLHKEGNIKFERQLNHISYFIYKPDTMIDQVCYNNYSKLCKGCEEPECELCGMSFKKHRKSDSKRMEGK